MNIAVVTHYFWPEAAAPSARLLELGRAWVASGHQVTVVTNLPNHPTGVVPEPYARFRRMAEEVGGIRVVRCRTYATPNRGFLRKTAGHLFFMWQAARQGPLLRGADVVVASSPTLFSVVAAWWLARRLRIPYVFEVRDLWPAIFADLGVIRNRRALALLERLEMALYRRSGAVVTVTRAFAEDIVRRGIPASKVHVVPNGVDLETFRPGPPDERLRRDLGLGDFVVLYCGAHGISQGLGAVLEAAERLREDAGATFLLVGEGADKDRLQAIARERGLPNVRFHPAVPREDVARFYRTADVCLVPLRDLPLFRGFVPSKMFEILACGRPILASLEGEARDILESSRAAVVVPPEDPLALAEAVRALRADPARREALARCARPFVAERYDRRRLAAEYRGILAGVVGSAVPE